MNKKILSEVRSRYKTEHSILKRIEWVTSRPKHEHEIPFLYAILGEIRVKTRRKNNTKLAYNQSKLKNDTIIHLRERVALYERNLKKFIEDRWVYVNVSPNTYKYYRFFFPISHMSPKGNINPIEGFTEDVALTFIDAFIKTEEKYNKDYYRLFCKCRWSGQEFIQQYNKGIDSYQKMFPGMPSELLYKLYNIRQAGSAAIGNGEYLMRLKIKDMNKEKDGDLCTDSGVNLEMKASGGRLSCQVQSDVNSMGEDMLGYGMIDKYKEMKNKGLSDKEIIRYFAEVKTNTYIKDISKEDRDLFITNMEENWDAFFFNGGFIEKSVDWINACYDGFAYPRLEKWTHLKIDSKQPVYINRSKNFNVRFRIFHKNDFYTPGLILNILENKQIIPSGVIKNNGRDKAIKVDVI